MRPGALKLTCAGFSHFLRKSSLALARNSLTVEDRSSHTVNAVLQPAEILTIFALNAEFPLMHHSLDTQHTRRSKTEKNIICT